MGQLVYLLHNLCQTLSFVAVLIGMPRWFCRRHIIISSTLIRKMNSKIRLENGQFFVKFNAVYSEEIYGRPFEMETDQA